MSPGYGAREASWPAWWEDLGRRVGDFNLHKPSTTLALYVARMKEFKYSPSSLKDHPFRVEEG